MQKESVWDYPRPPSDEKSDRRINPSPGYEEIRNHIAFYPSKMDGCWVDDDLVISQRSDFYGGWITSDIEGPIKAS